MTLTSLSNHHSRLLLWEGCANARELGGYPIAAGGQVRWGALVRSETTSDLTCAGQQAVLDYGIRTIIDLRFPTELQNYPSPFADPEWGVDYINIPLDQDQDMNEPYHIDPAGAVADLYIRILETNRNYVGCALRAMTKARQGGVLFHCAAGKDRTGIIAAMVLGSLGVPKEVIAEDYSLTYDLLAEKRAVYLNDPGLTPERRTYLTVLSSCSSQTMAKMIDYLDDKYGGVNGYLRTTSLKKDDLDMLKQRFVEVVA